MELPLPEVSHDLSLSVGETEYNFVVTANAVHLFNYYAIVVTVDMEDKFFEDFEIESIFLNQFFPVQNVESAISNIKACETNLEWIVEQSYKAFNEAEWTLISDNKKDQEEKLE
jgi:hypothetical protein|tara:strand:- start:4424 stop:4765 length:342 start_codon:yes stop_codon:yes gene_type:complete